MGPTGSGKSKKPKPVITKNFYIWLLDYPNDDIDDKNEYTFSEDMVLLKGYASLSNEIDDIDIRIKILDLVNAKFPEVTNFDFLKRERNSILPFVPPGWKWCFDNIKSLSGKG